MKIVIAPDSYKGSLSSIDAANIMNRAVTEVGGHHGIIKPMADGGEGTVESLLASSKGERVPIRCTGPLGEQIDTYYAILDDTTAVMECANIAGLVQVPEESRNPDLTTSYGLGEVIIAAIARGCTSIIIGLGGSATNDGGLGMLQALGMKSWDQADRETGPFGIDLLSLEKVSLTNLESKLSNVKLRIACDVDNPLCGAQGASAIYGPQKGATPEQISLYDKALDNFSNLVEKEIGRVDKEVPGAGAAGGLGFALLTLGAKLESGAKLMADAMNLEEAIKESDLVITGEGQSDEQTLFGKAPSFVASIANKYNVPTILISGSLGSNSDELRKVFAGCFSIIDKPQSLQVCIDQAEQLLYQKTKHIIHFVNAIK
ncbi:glycerate kinase [Aquibacillus halophilus]|uniref:Glycerate kinase n=1 Tax=Aquibacillus halophilus TaxID=930132 RepID=A0A6A8DG39_9BACI|nr:glycerate kinase [Aquibacillus halophilus]MRH42751.1 glycerate kinase [Aquibacillus halophilus]